MRAGWGLRSGSGGTGHGARGARARGREGARARGRLSRSCPGSEGSVGPDLSGRCLFGSPSIRRAVHSVDPCRQHPMRHCEPSVSARHCKRGINRRLGEAQRAHHRYESLGTLRLAQPTPFGLRVLSAFLCVLCVQLLATPRPQNRIVATTVTPRPPSPSPCCADGKLRGLPNPE